MLAEDHRPRSRGARPRSACPSPAQPRRRARRTSTNALTQLLGSLRTSYASRVVATGPYLRHQDQLSWVRIQRLADEIVGNVEPVELGTIDVVDPGSLCIAKNVECVLTAAEETPAPADAGGGGMATSN